MRPTAGHRFQAFDFEGDESKKARQVNVYFYAYLQNKIAVVADSIVEYSYADKADLQNAVLEHERMKAQLVILEELLGELDPPVELTEIQQTATSIQS